MNTLGCVAGDGFEKDCCFSTLKAGLPQLLGREAVLVLGQGILLSLSLLDVIPGSTNDRSRLKRDPPALAAQGREGGGDVKTAGRRESGQRGGGAAL